MCHTKATWRGFTRQSSQRRSFGPFVQCAYEVHVHALLLAQDAERSELPPLVRSEIGADLRLRPPPAEPLDEVQVVRLQQPLGDFDEARIPRQARLRIGVMHEAEDALLRLVAEKELHAALAGPGRPVLADRQ